MARPALSRGPTCLTCLRRLGQPFASVNGSPASVFALVPQLQQQQTRLKHKQNPPGIVVRLLEDVPAFGQKHAIFRIERGRMRNQWYPLKLAEYMTPARFRELGLTEKDVGNRDPLFGLNIEPEEPDLDLPVLHSLGVTPEMAQAILTQAIPEKLVFYRKPIQDPPSAPAPAAPRVSPLIASAQPPVQPKAEPTEALAIFGSVTTIDVVGRIKQILSSDADGSRIALEPNDIKFVGSTDGTSKLKRLGRFKVEISLRNSTLEPVRKTIEVLPSTDDQPGHLHSLGQIFA